MSQPGDPIGADPGLRAAGRGGAGFQRQPGAADLPPAVVRQAARWMASLQSGVASAADQQACERWRQAAPAHEQAWQRLQGLSGDLQAVARQAGPGVARAGLRPPRPGRRQVLGLMTGASLAGLLAWLARETGPVQALLADQSTATGEQRTLQLDDGSQLRLDTGTAVDLRFSARERRIRLRSGVIALTSGQDPLGRPLQIETGSGLITPIGTRFTVRYLPQLADETRVVVAAGLVEVRPGPAAAAPHRLAAGQSLRFNGQGVLAEQAAGPADLAWLDGMLVAERMPLAEVVAELARYRPGLLRCDPAVAGLRVSGAFALKDPAAVLQLLEETLPIRVRTTAKLWTTVGPC